MKEQKFFRCKHCGNFIGLIDNGGVAMTCCNEKMELLVPNTVEASNEKHLPKVETKDRLVYVEIGSVLHPAEEGHHIEFIYLQTENGGQRRTINVGAKPAAMFCLMDDQPISAYAYCNLHGLWKTDILCDCCGKNLVECDCDDDCGCGDHDHHHHHHGEACNHEDEETTCSAEFSNGCI